MLYFGQTFGMGSLGVSGHAEVTCDGAFACRGGQAARACSRSGNAAVAEEPRTRIVSAGAGPPLADHVEYANGVKQPGPMTRCRICRLDRLENSGGAALDPPAKRF